MAKSEVVYHSKRKWPVEDTCVFGINLSIREWECPLLILHFGHYLYFFGPHYAFEDKEE